MDDEIADPVASRVLARSPLGSAQVPDGFAAPENVVVVGAGWPEPLHPAAPPARLAAVTSTAAARPYLAAFSLIKITLCSLDQWSPLTNQDGPRSRE